MNNHDLENIGIIEKNANDSLRGIRVRGGRVLNNDDSENHDSKNDGMWVRLNVHSHYVKDAMPEPTTARGGPPPAKAGAMPPPAKAGADSGASAMPPPAKTGSGQCHGRRYGPPVKGAAAPKRHGEEL